MKKLKVVVVGGGGREHAIVMKLARSRQVETIFCTPGNGGISKVAECAQMNKATDLLAIKTLAKEVNADIVFVAPDDPLVLGMVDDLQNEGFVTFGPTKAAAIIEGSKVFSKQLMKKYNIPTAMYETFTNSKSAIDYVENSNKYPVVIKADGLALGKGVIIAENFEDAKNAIISILDDKIFGESGSKLIIEEFLTGPEVSVLCFTDGKTVKPMISSMDHKRAYDNDEGLNTGGMGTIAPNPYYTEEYAKESMEKIFIPTIEAMNKEGRTFKGCLYFGLMITSEGVKVIEYNCRFGDPETQVVLPLLETDLVDIIYAIHNETLDSLDIKWKQGAAACVVMASGGYPQKYQTGCEIEGLNIDGQLDEAYVYHAGTKYENGKFLTNGGRVLGVTAVGKNIEEAIKKSYKSVENVKFKEMHYRKDIGQKALNVIKNK